MIERTTNDNDEIVFQRNKTIDIRTYYNRYSDVWKSGNKKYCD